jgi:hypothetical protein
MGLADYKAETRRVEIKGCSFEVKGISLDSLTTLIQRHLSEIEAIFNEVEGELKVKKDLGESDIEQLILSCVTKVPAFVTSVICLASDEDTEAARKAVRSLPFPVQGKVLFTIVELTFDEVGGVKNAVESVARLIKTNLTGPTSLSIAP